MNHHFPKYPKIHAPFKRDMTKKEQPLIMGDWSMPEFEYLEDAQWEFTEKVDGTNIRVLWDGKGFTFGGRTDKAVIPLHLLHKLNEIFTEDLFAKEFGDTHVVVYGEGYGGNIQHGFRYRPDVSFIAFDILISGFWLKYEDVDSLCSLLKLGVVPRMGGFMTLREMCNFVTRLTSTWVIDGEIRKPEGVVGKTATGLLARNGRRIITKIKVKDFKGID